MNNPVTDLKAFFIDLSNDDHSEALECLNVAYEIQQEIAEGANPDEYFGVEQAKQVTSIFCHWMQDNMFKPDASFKQCAENILLVGLNY